MFHDYSKLIVCQANTDDFHKDKDGLLFNKTIIKFN